MTQRGNANTNALKTFISVKRRGLLSTLSASRKYASWVFRGRRRYKKIFRHSNIEDRFTAIFKINYWGNEESISGSGSRLHATENLRKYLPELFERFSIRSVFDAPCGDFNWMRHVIKDYPIDYTGGDIVLPLITSHDRKYRNNATRFVHIDLTKQKFPSADLMICRDCLFHLSYEDTKAALRNFIGSNINYLLTTTYAKSNTFSNKDIKTGDFRHIDLFSAPYIFPSPVLFRISDWLKPELEREMCLWSRQQIESSKLLSEPTPMPPAAS
jgi:hypothetical protein